MSKVSIRCIRSALIYLGFGIGLGVAFAFDRRLGGLLRPAHAEANLRGFVSLMIYGMAYHMVPRFMGRTLAAARLAGWQSILAIGGVGITIGGWIGVAYMAPSARPLLLLGGGMQALAMLLFGGVVLATIYPELLGRRANTQG